LEKAAGKHACWYTDIDKQYNQRVSDPESRNMSAIWAPIGLLCPTRGQFGLMNMGIVAQGSVRMNRAKHLSPYTKDHSINAADDFTGFADHSTVDGITVVDWEGLADSFTDHLHIADKCNYSLRGKKTFFGYPEAEF
jgi:hypothetical protein